MLRSRARPAAGGGASTPRPRLVPRAKPPPTGLRSPGTRSRVSGPGRRRRTAGDEFPPNGFGLFSLHSTCFFSSFPHGTCSLSVSRRYLALDGIYHPLCAAIPNNTTLAIPRVGPREGRGRGSHPLRRCVATDLAPSLRRLGFAQTTIPPGGGFQT